MKKVLRNHHEVAHVWAQQKQSEGRASNIFFEGPSIYSYGHHFEIARFITPEIVFFNPARYSPSTVNHQSRAHSAVSHKTVFTVPSMTDHTANAQYLVGGIVSEIASLKRARKGISYHVGRIEELIKEAHSYLAAFRRAIKLETRKSIRGLDKYRAKELPKEFLDLKLKREKDNEAIAEERYKVRREAERIASEERRRLKAIDDAEKIAKWKDGGDIYPSYEWPTLLRVKGDKIETSHGADIPLSAARRLWRRFLKDTGSIVGLNLGHYTIDALEVTDNTTGPDIQGTLRVGCHAIPTAELYRMADVLGWRDGVPFDASEVLQ